MQNILHILTNWRNFKLRLFVRGILVGLAAGTIVVLFRFTLQRMDLFLQHLYKILPLVNHWYTLLWVLILIFIAFLLGIIVKKQPLTSGSGIPQVKGVVLNRINMQWLPVLIWKFVGGVLAIGAGLSLGREGPSIQLGASAAQGIGNLLGSNKMEQRILITSGAGAGLAAAFNAPLAGVIFCLEEMHKNFSPTVLLTTMAASLTSDCVCQYFFGQKPIFNFHTLPLLPLDNYLYLLILGAILGAFGALFNYCLIKSLNFYKLQTLIPSNLKAIIPLLISVPVGFLLPQCLGGGNNLINSILNHQFPLTLLLILVTVKFIFTMLSYGSDVPGGIFLPLLVIGALTGDVFGNISIYFFHFDPIYINNFTVFAMAGYFTAIVKAPVTGIILITEMTGSFHHLLPLTIVSMSAYVVSDLCGGKPIYDQLLNRLLVKNDINLQTDNQRSQTLLEVAVNLGAKLEGKMVKDIIWPEDCLLVSIRRGTAEIIPHGNTRIMLGDYIYVLTGENNAAATKKALLAQSD